MSHDPNNHVLAVSPKNKASAALLEVFDYDGVLAGISGAPDLDLFATLKNKLGFNEQLLVAINTGRSFTQLDKLGVIKLFESFLPAALSRICVCCEKGGTFSTYQNQQWQTIHSSHAFTLDQLLALELALNQFVLDYANQNSSCAELIVVRKESLVTLEVYAKPQQILAKTDRQKILEKAQHFLEKLLNDQTVPGISQDTATLDLTNIAIDIQSRSHGKAAGALLIESWLINHFDPRSDFIVTTFGDSRSDLEMALPFLKKYRTSHIHTGATDLLKDLSADLHVIPIIIPTIVAEQILQLSIPHPELKRHALNLSESALEQVTKSYWQLINWVEAERASDLRLQVLKLFEADYLTLAPKIS
jgi:hypothetical protein